MINENGTVLIVDDMAENIDVLHSLLKNDYELKVATSAAQALQIVKETALPDLILLDIMMPDMDGYETIVELKQNPRTKNIPVIFITSKVESEDIVKGFDLGAVDYVVKPFNAPELFARVKTQITAKKNEIIIKQRSRELKELLQIMSHDLANHFSVIQSAVWLSENKENKTLDSYKDKIKKAAKNGIDIIDLVREMRSVEDKKFPLQKVYLLTAISDSIMLIQDKIYSKNICIDVNIQEDYTVMVEPRSFINSVINNILSNAIKFSHADATIVISANRTDQGLDVSFKDSGIGIPEELIYQLFNFSKRTTRLGTSGEKGTGFGMPLIKKFVELYGGQIAVKSPIFENGSKNYGTEIILSLKAA